MPSKVYGTANIADTYSVFQINTGIAMVEPGFSRIQVSYQYYDSTAGNMNDITEYFDCPFYEGFNTTARELNNLVDYIQEGYSFLQHEIDILAQEVKYALSHELWRGTSVSGQISFIPASEGLQTGPLTESEFPHGMSVDSKSIGLAGIPTFAELKSGALSAGSSGISLTQTTPISEYGRDTSASGAAGNFSYGFYVTEAVDGGGNRCVVLVDSVPWADSSLGSITLRHDFAASGGAVDRTLGQTTNKVYTQVTSMSGSTNSNSTIAMNSSVTSTYPTQTGASPNQNTLGAYSRVYEQYPFNALPAQRYVGFIASSNPVWCKGYDGSSNNGNNDGPDGNDNGVFSPPTSGPTNNTATGVVASGWTGMAGAKWDTINLGGENYPRLVFYPDDSTTSLTLLPMFMDAMTNEAYNGGGGDLGFNRAIEGMTLTGSTMNGTSLNSGNAILPYTLNLTPVVPANPPVFNSTNPNSGCVGATLTLTGNYFSKTYDSVYIAGQPCAINVLNPNTVLVTVPSVSYGPTQLYITDGHHPVNNASIINFTVLGQPLIGGISPSQAPVGNQVTISGNNFGTLDGGSSVVFGSTTATIVSWNNTSIVAEVPNGLSIGPIQVQVNSDCGEASTSQFSVSNPDSIVINPHTQTVSANTTFQFQALFYASHNPAVDVTTNANTHWYVNGALGGENVHGTITQSGLYTAPTNEPPSAIAVMVEYFDTNTGLFIADTATVTLIPSPLITLSPANIQLGSGAIQQYITTLYANGNTTDVTSSSTYFVNETPNGDVIDGFITTGGLYTAPNNLTQATNEIIGASYSYEGVALTATAIATVAQAPVDHASITVTSQINVFLGDGRFGYIPTGTQIIAYPAQYVYVQFQELLDKQFHLPVSTYIPVQQLSMNTKNALDPDVANVIYNLADLSVQPDGTTQTLRTVVLGIIDPSDGRFHSMWDIGNPLPGAVSGAHDLPSKDMPAKAAENIPAFTGKDISLMDYINDLSGGAKNQLEALNQKSNIMLVGNCEHNINDNTFIILDSLNILKVSGENSYGIIGTIPKQTISLKPNQYLFIDENQKLQVKNFSDLFLESQNVNTIIVGTVLDKFYTTWPLLSMLDVDTSRVQEFGKTSVMKVGPLVIQWGLTEKYQVDKKGVSTQHIELEESFYKSFVVLTQPYNSNGGFVSSESTNVNLTSFDIKIINTGSTKVTSQITWMAIGM